MAARYLGLFKHETSEESMAQIAQLIAAGQERAKRMRVTIDGDTGRPVMVDDAKDAGDP